MRILWATTLTLGLSVTGLAASKTQPLSPFKELKVADGFEVTVSCGKSNQVVMTGSDEALSSVRIDQDDEEVKVDKKGSHYHANVKLAVTTSTPLSEVSFKNGVAVTLPACAVNTSSIEVNLHSGAMLNMVGKTKKLSLEGARGISFNNHDKTKLSVDSVEVEIKDGAKAYFCDAKAIKGRLSRGSIVFVGSNTNTDDLSTGWGTTQKVCH